MAGCFVVDQADLTMTEQGTIYWAQVIGKEDDACKLSLFYLEAHPGKSSAIDLNASEAVLYLQHGCCEVSICGQLFQAEAGTGVHVRSGEQFSLHNHSGEAAKWLISICPRVQGLQFDDQAGAKFDKAHPERTVSTLGQDSHASGDRFYKLLVGPGIGSESVTQFIGRIPRSKAPEHYHLYEEAICILSGHGRMWNGDQYTEVRPGSMIFLPRKQAHCLECLDENGMELMGVFYPAGSPAINYKT